MTTPIYLLMLLQYIWSLTGGVHLDVHVFDEQVDHMVSLAKDGSLHARRQALSYIYDKELVHALFEQVRT